MRRGEVWTAAGGPDYAGKPRPAVIIQDDRFAGGRSVTICALTTSPVSKEMARLSVLPTDDNGLREPSWLMVDKITTLPRTKLGRHIGHLAEADVTRLNQAILIFLGLAD